MAGKTPSAQQKRMVRARAQLRCEYCLCPDSVTPLTFHVDHILPYGRGGKTELDNLALSCGCNTYKGDRTFFPDPQTGRPAPLFHPRKQSWAKHFSWSENTLEIIGLTPTGRATVIALRMNRKELIKLRGMLKALGEHPPESN